MRSTAFAHVGLSGDAERDAGSVLADAFTALGGTLTDVADLIEGLHLLAHDPEALGPDGPGRYGAYPGVDSEGSLTDLYLARFSLHPSAHRAGEPGLENLRWLAPVEIIHATWPRLLDVLGVTVGGVVFVEHEGKDIERRIDLNSGRVPKALRLQSGWDYDGEGHQVWLPFEEAWRRLAAHNSDRRKNHDRDRIRSRDMEGTREHMRAFYDGHPTTRAAALHREATEHSDRQQPFTTHEQEQ
ncbi:hypothetical protein [Nocardioides sp. Leaf285]|uniref:hypothetical protein n=1 Tax=Nocardioides sp. Leaf285 TaxID=1736322 RepID=UPI000703A7CD|nr:hypothetical protein [Nocardioides sp. Leaf285]KQP63167.1 hypothetical protein ASF47_19345 [Nocardioides sp. Leaf285]